MASKNPSSKFKESFQNFGQEVLKILTNGGNFPAPASGEEYAAAIVVVAIAFLQRGKELPRHIEKLLSPYR